MRFAHMADCHIGSWRDDKLRDVSTQAFEKAIDECIKREVDFVLISGDLFNTAVPAIESLRIAVKKLSQLRDRSIPVYLISGSHDYSPSGKTMLDVLEEAGLCTNVAVSEYGEKGLRLKFTIDESTGAKIVGLLGRRGGLEDSYYKSLDRTSLESADGFKIFMFHSAIEEYKPKGLTLMDAIPLSVFPKGFDYYAGGHVHVIEEHDEPGYGKIVYPGPLFPNDFKEIEKLGRGGFYVYDDGNLEYIPVEIYKTDHIDIDCEGKPPETIKGLVLDKIRGLSIKNAIITMRFKGKLSAGSPSDIDWSSIISEIYSKGAYFVMKNASRVSGQDFEEIKLDTKPTEEIERDLINEHLGQIDLPETDEKSAVIELMKKLDDERQDGERVSDYERRLLDSVDEWISSHE